MESPTAKFQKQHNANNIILFPKLRNITKMQSAKEQAKNEQFVALVQIEHTVNEIVDDLVMSLTNNKVELDDTPQCTKQFALCIEAIKGLISARRGIPYQMHKVADKLFRETENNSVSLVSEQMMNRMMRKGK